MADNYLGDYTNLFAYFGAAIFAFYAAKFFLSICGGIKAYVLARVMSLGADVKNMGEWAVVTGATDGIGKAYAEELAKKGMKVVLISRTPEKLQDVAKAIGSKYNVETKCIAVDFTTPGLDIYHKIEKELNGLQIGVLVNNVGMSYPSPEFYGEIKDQKLVSNIINCNCQSVSQMTWIVLPQMVERKMGAIINISSGSACQPSPLLTVYSATKIYVDYFSQALQTEYRNKGIIVQSVLPFFVSTKLSKIKRSSYTVPNPTSFARSALATVGLQERTFGCLPHAVQGYVSEAAPSVVFQTVVMMIHLQIRRAVKKKMAAKKD